MGKKRNQPKRRKPVVTGEQHELVRVVVDEDGNEKERFMTQKELSEVQKPTTHLHEELDAESTVVARFTFKHAGRFFVPTYEQWENGFLRERDPERELAFWLHIAAFLRSQEYGDKERMAIISEVCTGNASPKLSSQIDKFADQLDTTKLLSEISGEFSDEP